MSENPQSPSSRPKPDHAGNGVLSGVRVIEITQMLAGPFCSMMLADQGADVIKIEPIGGEQTRRAGPFLPSDPLKAFGGYYQSVNRNKKSLVLNLKSKEGQQVVKDLVKDADILIENFRQGTMDKMGLSYEELSKINPKLVYGAIRGFGDERSGESPYAEWPAYDVVAQAMGGIMSITGPGPNQPIKIGPGIGDLTPAMMLAFALIAALRHAEKTGQGQFVDVAMYDAILAVCERMIYQKTYADIEAKQEGNAHPMIAPFGVFPAKDGWVSIACPLDKFWQRLTLAMGRPELAQKGHYATAAERRKPERNREIVDLVSRWSEQYTKEELAAKLGGKVPFGPVQTVNDILDDPHVAARNLLADIEQPGSGQTARIVNTPIHMSQCQGGIRHPAPLLGEHTSSILEQLGYSEQQIADLRAQGFIE